MVRFFILRAHYRSPLNYSDAHLEEAKQALTRLYTALTSFKEEGISADWNAPAAGRFKEAMDDDFNTPEAIAVLHQLANEVFQGSAGAARALKSLGAVLGLLQREPQEFLQGPRAAAADAWIEERIAARKAARQRRDFKGADDIRNELLEKGIVLEDSGKETTWRRK